MTDSSSAIDWFLDSDASIRWQVMRHLLDAPESEWKAERAKVETGRFAAPLGQEACASANGMGYSLTHPVTLTWSDRK